MSRTAATPAVRKVVAHVVSHSPYSQNKVVASPKQNRESDDAHEKRTWRERAHVRNGKVFIPGVQFKGALIEAAKLNPIKKKGNQKYRKTMEGGILPSNDIVLNVSSDDMEGEWVHVPSNGQPGGGRRVWKCFPYIEQWEGDIEFIITNNSLPEEIIEQYLREAGMFIGIGRWRAAKGGMYGKFLVDNVEWKEASI